jgi:large subunit ribosomal protein LP0
MPSRERKEEYCVKLKELLTKYNKIMIVGADNVGSSHMQQIRSSIRGKGVLLMGKNTMVRRVIRTEFTQFESILPQLEGNVGLLFTDADLSDIKDIIVEQKVAAPAKAGAISPCDVTIPAGDTGLEPTQTAFLQALNIASRINRGQIMILNEVKLVSKGDKVGASQATLLQKLKIKPFQYGLTLQAIYDDGSVYGAEVLDFTFDTLSSKISFAATRIACIGLAIGHPCLPALPHSMARGFKNLLSIAVATDIEFKQAEEIKNLLNMDPEALAAMVATSAPAASGDAPAEAAPAEEEEEEEDEDMGFGLFD